MTQAVQLDPGYAIAWALGALPDWSRLAHGLVLGGTFGFAAVLVLAGVVLNAVSAGFRELHALQRRP